MNTQAQSRYEIPCDKRVFEYSLKVLQSLEGTRETTSKNDGVKINEIQMICGIPKGAPYCNATQYYTFYKSAEDLQLDIKAIPIPKNGLAQSSFIYASKHGKKTAYNAEYGDLLVWARGNSINGHIERVTEIRSMGWVITLGGNVSATIDGKTVEGIFYKKRHLANPLGRLLQPKGLVGLKTN